MKWRRVGGTNNSIEVRPDLKAEKRKGLEVHELFGYGESFETLISGARSAPGEIRFGEGEPLQN